MSNEVLHEELKAALEALIVETQAKGPGKIPSEADRDAVLRARIKRGAVERI